MTSMEQNVTTIEETYAHADALISELMGSDMTAGTAMVVGLSGGLGAGNTTYMRGVARALGLTDNITSPTFVIAKHYKLEGQPFDQLIHIDAYRIEDERELGPLHWNDMITNPKNLVFVEWPEHIQKSMPRRALELVFLVHDDGTRTITRVEH